VLRAGPGEAGLVLHFWATWCPACGEELHVLEQAAASCPSGAVRVIAVDVGDDPESIARYLRENGLSLSVLLDAHGEVWRSLGFRSLPASWFWTAKSSAVSAEPLSVEQWRARLDELGCAVSGG
jgi:thiol-disulfide isomerase/thioredoxin